jgi:regulator of replication initiation timing
MRLEQVELLPTILQKINLMKIENADLKQKVQQLTEENTNLKNIIDTKLKQLEDALTQIVNALGI